MPRGRVRCGAVGNSKHPNSHHGNLNALLDQGIDSLPSTPRHSNHTAERGEKGCLTQYSASLLSSLAHPNVSLSTSSLCDNVTQSSPSQKTSTEPPYYPNWSPLAVRLEGCFPIEPTAPENVRLPPYAPSQDLHNSLSLGCCNIDGSINFQKIQQSRNNVVRHGQSKKTSSPLADSNSKVSQCGTFGEKKMSSLLEISPKDVVIFCCHVHFNLKNVGLRDAEVVHLIDLLEATLASLLASSSKLSSTDQTSFPLNSLEGSTNSSQNNSNPEQSTFASSKFPSEDAGFYKSKKLSISDGVFFVTLDLSENHLTCKGIERISKWFLMYSRHIRLRVLKLYKNSISDYGAFALAELIRAQPSALEELHLSHNRIHAAGAEALFRSIGEATVQRKNCKEPCEYVYPRPGPTRQEFLPVWIRLEYNYILESCTLLQNLEAELRKTRQLDTSWKLACFADRPNTLHCGKNPHCSPARCLRSVSGNSALLHLYSFYHQSTGPRSAPGLTCGRPQDRRKAKLENHLTSNSRSNVFSGTSGSSKPSGRKSQRVVTQTKQKQKQEKQALNSASLNETSSTVQQPHQGKKKLGSKFNAQNDQGLELSPGTQTPDSALERNKTTPLVQHSENVVLNNGGGSSFSPPVNGLGLEASTKSLKQFVELRDNDSQKCSESQMHHNQSCDRQFENKQDWLLERFAINCQASQSCNIMKGVFSFPGSVSQNVLPSQTLKNNCCDDNTSTQPRRLELLDSAVVLVGNIAKRNSDSSCGIRPLPKGGQKSQDMNLCKHQSNNAYFLDNASSNPSLGVNFGSSGAVFSCENDFSLSNCLAEPAGFNSSTKIHATPLSSLRNVEKFKHSCEQTEKDSNHGQFRVGQHPTGGMDRKRTCDSRDHEAWKNFHTIDAKHFDAHQQSSQPGPPFLDAACSSQHNYRFNKEALKRKSVEVTESSQQIPSQIPSFSHDNSTLYIFIDSSAYLHMRKLFTEGNPNIFSFPALAALQQSGALVQALSSPESRIPINSLNNIILIYLDVVKDRVKKITEDMPFLRQSIVETQNSFVNFLHEHHVIEKVKGLGNKDSFPDWTTWNKDVFYQAKLLEDTAFESLRVLDFACVWEYHLNVLGQCNPSDGTSGDTCRPFSIFVTGDARVENFLVYLSQRQESVHPKSCGSNRSNHVNLVCTHIDRLNHRILQAFPDLAQALKQHEFLEKDSFVTFKNTPLENVLSASALRKLMRKYFHVSPDVLLNTTELISSLKEASGLARSAETVLPPISQASSSSLDLILTKDNIKTKFHTLCNEEHDAKIAESKFTTQEELDHLRHTNNRLIKEIEHAYFLLMEILECDVSRVNGLGAIQKVALIRKELLQRCLYRCKHWETLLAQLGYV